MDCLYYDISIISCYTHNELNNVSIIKYYINNLNTNKYNLAIII